MANPQKMFDVFITHGPSDTELAANIAATFRQSHLEPFTLDELPPGEPLSDLLRTAIAGSRALLAVVSRPEISPSMTVEIGAAQAWNKPIFVVVSDPSQIRIPTWLSKATIVSPVAVDDVIRTIKQLRAPLGDKERRILAELYRELGTPADLLPLEYEQLDQLSEQFASKTGMQMRGEQLLGEILRMRMSGQLGRTAGNRRIKKRRNPA